MKQVIVVGIFRGFSKLLAILQVVLEVLREEDGVEEAAAGNVTYYECGSLMQRAISVRGFPVRT